jgi:poly-gamma-glutamate synthesis protein (capsule biosynthesis protein)
VFQGPEVRHNRLILYDTGDFLDDYAVDPVARNDWSFVFLLELSGSGAVERLRLVPVRLDFAVVNLAAAAAAGDRDRMVSGATWAQH